MSLDHLARARELLATTPLVDGHNDLPVVIRRSPARGDLLAFDPARLHPETDTDIPRLRAGLVSAQFFAAFSPTNDPHPGRTALEQIALIRKIEETYPEVFTRGRRSTDIVNAKRDGKIAVFITVENGVALENSLAPLSIWFAAGVRLVTLCHNETLDWIDSATDKPRHFGLTQFGRQVILEMNRLGMIVDCSHVSPKATQDVLEVSEAPIVLSHSNAYQLCDHPRNANDDLLDQIAAKSGLVMVNFIPDFVSQQSRDWNRLIKDEWGRFPAGSDRNALRAQLEISHGPCPRATLSQVCDHLDYLSDRIGSDHIGIGSDFHGGPTPDGLNDASCYPALIAELMRRGWSDKRIVKLASGNLVRVFREVERSSRRLGGAKP